MLNVAVIGREVEPGEIEAAEGRMADYHLDDYHLAVIQGSQRDSLLALVGELQTTKTDYKQTVLQQNLQIHELETALHGYERYEALSAELRSELRVLYPHIHTFSLAQTVEHRTDTALATPIVVALVGTGGQPPLSTEQRRQLADWLKARTQADSLHVVNVAE